MQKEPKMSRLKKLDELSKLYKKWPQMAGIVAENFSKERFVRKNWADNSIERWEPRKPAPEWASEEWKKRAQAGSLLVGPGSGRLKRSVRRLKVTRNSVTIGTDVPYAQIHNEGGVINQKINIKAHSRKRKGRTEQVKAHKRKRQVTIPKRQFIGESKVLLRRLERMVEKQMNDILKR